MKVFDKYDKNGAYHLDWFRTNKFGYRDRLNRILSEFNRCKSKTILDVGCGEGLLCKLLIKKGVVKKINGVDTSSKAIELGRIMYSDSHVKKLMQLDNMSFIRLGKNKRYDHVICSEVLEHIKKPKMFISKINRTMKEWSIVTTPNSDFVTPGEYDYQFFNEKSMKELLDSLSIKYTFLELGETLIVKLIK